MLLLRRERVFARATAAPGGGGTVLTVGSLTRGGGEGGERFAGLADELRAALSARAPASPPADRRGSRTRRSPPRDRRHDPRRAVGQPLLVSVGLYSLAVVAFCAQLAFGRRPAAARELVGAGAAAEPPAAPAGPAAEPPAVRRYGIAAMVLTLLGALTHAGVLVFRGLATDRLPWATCTSSRRPCARRGGLVRRARVRRPVLRHLGVFVIAPVVLALVRSGSSSTRRRGRWWRRCARAGWPCT